MSIAARPRRLFVSGGSRLSKSAALLWQELGKLLAREDDLVVITGGLSRREDDPLALPADRMIIDGMLPVLKDRGVSTLAHIETLLPDPDPRHLIRFKEGLVRTLKNRDPQARRFSMVDSADVVISIEGERGTRSVINAALAFGHPILPLPFNGGASGRAWKKNSEDILNWFGIGSEEAEYFESLNLQELDDSEMKKLAIRVRDCLLRGFQLEDPELEEPPEPSKLDANFVFISYKREDLPRIVPFMHRIVSWGFPIWYDLGIPGGAEWDELIEEKVSRCNALVVFLSDAAVESKWVRREIKFADSENRPVLGIRLDKDVQLKHGLKVVMTQYQMIDASSADFSDQLRKAIEYVRIM